MVPALPLVRKQAHRAIHWPHIRGLVKTGVWLRAKETEISAALWAIRLGKDFTFTFFMYILYQCCLTCNVCNDRLLKRCFPTHFPNNSRHSTYESPWELTEFTAGYCKTVEQLSLLHLFYVTLNDIKDIRLEKIAYAVYIPLTKEHDANTDQSPGDRLKTL